MDLNRLRGRLVHVKDKPPRHKQSDSVYGFQCKVLNCSEAYVGETKQCLKDLAIFEHSKTCGHQINTEDVVILDREERWFERGVREAIWKRVEKPFLNKHGGLRFQLLHVCDQSLINIPCQLTLDQSSSSVLPTHLCSCLMKSNEFGLKFAGKLKIQYLIYNNF